MLSQATIHDLNREITKELRHYDSIFCETQEDKMACLERISKLKSLLAPSPTAEEIASALVNATSSGDKPKPESTVANVNLGPLVDAIMNLSRFKKQ